MSKHLSKLLFISIFILNWGKFPMAYALGATIGSFALYWAIILIISLYRSRINKTKFIWQRNNYLLIIPLVQFLVLFFR